MARFLIAAAHKSSGKTVISTGLAGALSAAGHAVQCFKKGPDYIDPMWLAAASGRACYNLDFNTMTSAGMSALLQRQSKDADLAMIEANKGLFDGVDPKGSDSNAELAKQLKTPVILVIDTTGMTRGIAPLLLGYRAFDADVNIAGVILNKVGGARHEAKLRAALETYCDIPVLGAVWRTSELDIGERHLGLTTPAESTKLGQMIAGFARIVGAAVDLDRLLDIARAAPVLSPSAPVPATPPQFPGLCIAIARDAGFGFYYPDDLQAFSAAGATLVPFDATRTATLPKVDGLFIGGGFPEVQMAALAQNARLRADIKAKIVSGLPAYAECGGLMYLCRSLTWHGETLPMCDVIAGDAVMCERPQGRGYTRFQDTAAHPWGAQPEAGPAHEFHYARIDNLPPDTAYARQILRGHGVDGAHDAIFAHNLLAGFCHLRDTPDNPWVARFLAFVARHKRT